MWIVFWFLVLFPIHTLLVFKLGRWLKLLQNCYFLPCCFTWTKGAWGLWTPFQLPSHVQNLTFGRLELFEAAGDSWRVWTEGNDPHVPNTLSQCPNSRCLKSIWDVGFSIWPFCTTVWQFLSGFPKQWAKLMYSTGRILVWDWVILIFLLTDICGFILVPAQENTPTSTSKTQFIAITLLALVLYIAGSGSNCSAVCRINAQVERQSNSFHFQSKNSKFYFG